MLDLIYKNIVHYKFEESEEDKAIALATVPFEISLQDLYNKVKFEPVEFEEESADVEGLG